MYSVRRSIDIHYAHRIQDHPGKCAGLHGHRGVVTVELTSVALLRDMVEDFGVVDAVIRKRIKDILCHSTILQESDELVTPLSGVAAERWRVPGGAVEVVDGLYGRVVLVERRPTAEVLAQVCFDLVKTELPYISGVSFFETASSEAVFRP